MTRSSSSKLVASFYSWRMFIAAVCAVILVSIPALAQNSTGRIIGTVTDAQGAAIAGAKVTVTNTATNTHWGTLSGSDGAYQVLELPIGNYSVTAEHEGFTKAVTAALPLEINQSLRIDVHMKVGSVAEVVKVEAAAVQVETVNPTVGGTVTGAPIQNLPLNGRDTLDLALTMPGITPSAGSPFSQNGVPTGKFSIAGGHDNSITYLLDGGDNTSVTYGVPVLDPNPDTIAEFRILTNNYTAEFGRSAGGVVSVVTKSGTNQFHGSVFDYLRNDALNADTFFNKSNPADLQPTPILKRNQFGGTIGGPITIPKLVNGKDRFFFFFAYQGQRQHSVAVGPLFTTFTPAELNGDFSHSGPNGGPDPNVAAFLQSHNFFQANPVLAAQAIIDPTKIDTVAQAYIKNNLIPTTSNGLIIPNGPGSDTRDEYNGKFDFFATEKDRITVTLAKFHNPVHYPFLTTTSAGSAPNVPGFPGLNKVDSYFGNIGYTRTISQNMLNEFRMTAQRANNILNVPQRQLPGPQSLGVNIIPDDTTGPPQVFFLSSGLQIGFNINGPADFADTTYVYTDTLSWTKGRHTWRMGGQLGIVQNNAFFDFANDGQFQFIGPTASGSQNDRADFLFGTPTFFEQFPRGYSAIRSHQYSVFGQDEWKVTPRLVLTLGVRYEYNTPKSDPQKRQYMLLPGLQSKRDPFAPLGLVFPGDPGTPNGISFPDRNDWAPRIGFAWDPFGNGKTSVRGGFGIFYDVLLGQDNQFQNGTVPLFAAAFICVNIAGCVPVGNPGPGGFSFMSDPYGSTGIINPFPSRALPPLSQRNFATLGFLPIGFNSVFLDPHMRTPYIYQYNLNVQRQLGNGLAAEIGYVGSSSHKLTANVDFDPFLPGSLLRLQNKLNGFTNPLNPTYTSTVGTSNALNGTYNGLIASMTKRINDWHSLGSTFFTLSYTWSHEIDDGTGMFRNTSQVSFFNHHQFHGTGDADLRNRFVFSGGWEMPFAHLWGKAPKQLTSGWSLFPIITVQSGLPMDVNGGLSVSGFPGPSGAGDQGIVKPNWAGGSPKSLDPHQVQTFSIRDDLGNVVSTVKGNFIFDPSNIVEPNCYFNPLSTTLSGCPQPTYGTLPRNFFRGPGRTNFDLALEKKTNFFGEKLQMTFRVEYFNILNHTEFQNPAGGPASVFSPQLGQVVSTFDPRIGQVSLRFAF